jgi:hypothetical protein
MDTDAESYATQAAHALAPDDELWPDAQVLLARVLIALGRRQMADDIRAKVESRLQRQGSRPSAALAWTRWLREPLHDAVNTDKTSAIDTALAAEGPSSPTAIEMRIALARSLIEISHFDKGRETIEVALATMRAMGGVSPFRAALAEGNFWARLYSMRGTSYEEAVWTIERDRALLAPMPVPVPAQVQAQLDFTMAEVHIDHGSLQLGSALLEASAPTLLASTQSLRVRYGIIAVQGTLALLLGKHDETDRLTSERIGLREQLGQKLAPFAAYDWANRAVNLTMKGDYEAAQAILDAAPSFGVQRSGALNVGSYERILPIERARLLLARGDAAGAFKALPPLPLDAPPDDSSLFAERSMHGEVLCALGDSAQGLKFLHESLASIGRFVSKNDPGLARLRAQAGRCALASGDRATAVRHATLARAAFTEQPAVSPYFKAPLIRLEEALALRTAGM